MSSKSPAKGRLTRLEAMEAERMRHVAAALRASLPAHLRGDPLLEASLDALAAAAVDAADRFPTDGFPFGRDLNAPPEGVHADTLRSLNAIDAAVFNGDRFLEADAHLYLAAHVQRWSKALTASRRDDWYNRLEDHLPAAGI